MKTVFLSGSRAISRLNAEIRERLENITSQSFRVLVGDANGADKALQAYLKERRYQNVTVYCSGQRCRNNVGSWKTEYIDVPPGTRGRDFYTRKDRVMAQSADYGFVLWDGKSAGSIENVVSLLKRGKKALVYYSPGKDFLSIAAVQDLKRLLARTTPEALEAIGKKVMLEKAVCELEYGLQAEMGI